jgi:histidyl-tRNA synthetase
MPPRPRVAVLAADDESNEAAFQLAEGLRDAGFDIDLPTSGAVGKKLKKADRNGICLALILGGDERARNSVQLRNLGDGSQQEIRLGEVGVDGLAVVIADFLKAP